MRWLFKNILLITVVALVMCKVDAFSFYFNSTETLKFAHISDIHLSDRKENTTYKLLANSRDLLKDEVKQINSVSGVDFVMLTGDGVDIPRIPLLNELIANLNTLRCPWYMAFGNHDISIDGPLSKKKYLAILRDNNKKFKFTNSYYSFSPKKGFLVIVLDGVIDNAITANGYISETQVEWFRKMIKNSGSDVVLVFCHYPVYEPFKSPHHRIKNADQIYRIMKNANKPIAYFSGHYHASKITKDGNILNVSTPSLVTYPNAFRIVKVTNEKDKITFKFDFKETNYSELQTKARLLTFSQSLYKGAESDRFATVVMDKR